MTKGTAPSPDLQFVTANLNFFDARLKSPSDFRWTAEVTPSERPSNTNKPDTHQVRIYDLRRLSSSERNDLGFTLGRCGFEIMQGWDANGDDGNVAKAWGERKWEIQDWIETEYYSYVERHVVDNSISPRLQVYWSFS